MWTFLYIGHAAPLSLSFMWTIISSTVTADTSPLLCSVWNTINVTEMNCVLAATGRLFLSLKGKGVWD